MERDVSSNSIDDSRCGYLVKGVMFVRRYGLSVHPLLRNACSSIPRFLVVRGVRSFEKVPRSLQVLKLDPSRMVRRVWIVVRHIPAGFTWIGVAIEAFVSTQRK